MSTIEIVKDKRGEFRFRVKARNGEVIATGESYRNKAKALATLKTLKAAVSGKVVDLTAAPAKQPKKATAKTSKTASSKKASGSSAKTSKASKATPAKKGAASRTTTKKATPKKAAAASRSSGAKAQPTRSAKAAPAKGRTRAGVSKQQSTTAPDSPAVADEPRLFSPASPPRPLSETAAARPDEDDAIDNPEQADDLDRADGADLVTLDELGDGDQVSTDLQDGDVAVTDDDAMD